MRPISVSTRLFYRGLLARTVEQVLDYLMWVEMTMKSFTPKDFSILGEPYDSIVPEAKAALTSTNTWRKKFPRESPHLLRGFSFEVTALSSGSEHDFLVEVKGLFEPDLWEEKYTTEFKKRRALQYAQVTANWLPDNLKTFQINFDELLRRLDRVLRIKSKGEEVTAYFLELKDYISPEFTIAWPDHFKVELGLSNVSRFLAAPAGSHDRTDTWEGHSGVLTGKLREVNGDILLPGVRISVTDRSWDSKNAVPIWQTRFQKQAILLCGQIERALLWPVPS